MRSLYQANDYTEIEFIETFLGSEIRVKRGNGLVHYVASVRNGIHTFCTDYAYAKHYNQSSANKYYKI